MNPFRSRSRTLVPFLAAGALVAVPAAASAASVEPVYHEGNPNCMDLGYGHEIKFDPPSAGTKSGDGVSVQMSIGADQFGAVVDWSSSAAIDAVIVKGGPNANAYVYAGESSGDTGLHAPFNGPDKYYGLSHVNFCWDDETPPGDDTPPVKVTPPASTPGDGDVLPARVVSGRSRLLGPSGCAGKTVKATVRGRQIAKV